MFVKVAFILFFSTVAIASPIPETSFYSGSGLNGGMFQGYLGLPVCQLTPLPDFVYYLFPTHLHMPATMHITATHGTFYA